MMCASTQGWARGPGPRGVLRGQAFPHGRSTPVRRQVLFVLTTVYLFGVDAERRGAGSGFVLRMILEQIWNVPGEPDPGLHCGHVRVNAFQSPFPDQ